jgi:hypothetical protein
MACCLAAVARLHKSVTNASGRQRLQYSDATVGLQYVAARAVRGTTSGIVVTV